jgi:hypothetical protein
MKKTILLLVALALICFLAVVTFGRRPALTRKTNVYKPEWNAVFDFIKTADKVEPIATTYDAFEFDQPPSEPAKFLSKFDPTGHHLVQEVPLTNRTALVQILKGLPDDQNVADACFCPHHFIVAVKGSQRIVVSICYSCEGIAVSGALKMIANLRADTKDEVSKFFGLDVFPNLDKRCYYNQGRYDPGNADHGIKGPP